MNAQYQKGEMGSAAAAILLKVRQQGAGAKAVFDVLGEWFGGAELGAPPTAVKLGQSYTQVNI